MGTRNLTIIEKLLRTKLQYLKGRCINGRGKKEDKPKKPTPFNLDMKWLTAQIYAQNSCCFYSDIPFDLEPDGTRVANWNAMAFDKLIPKRGYVKGNIVLAVNKVNTLRSYDAFEGAEEICSRARALQYKNRQKIALRQAKKGIKIIRPK